MISRKPRQRREGQGGLIGRRIHPEKEVFVGVGATEVMFAATQGILNPGDEVIVFEPSFDIYNAQVRPLSRSSFILHPSSFILHPLDSIKSGTIRTRNSSNNSLGDIFIATPKSQLHHTPTDSLLPRLDLKMVLRIRQQPNWDTLRL